MHQIIVLLGSSMTGSIRREYSLNNGSISAGLTPGDVSIDPSPFASPVVSVPVSVLRGVLAGFVCLFWMRCSAVCNRL